jgi:hypothetical protein
MLTQSHHGETESEAFETCVANINRAVQIQFTGLGSQVEQPPAPTAIIIQSKNFIMIFRRWTHDIGHICNYPVLVIPTRFWVGHYFESAPFWPLLVQQPAHD